MIPATISTGAWPVFSDVADPLVVELFSPTKQARMAAKVNLPQAWLIIGAMKAAMNRYMSVARTRSEDNALASMRRSILRLEADIALYRSEHPNG